MMDPKQLLDELLPTMLLIRMSSPSEAPRLFPEAFVLEFPSVLFSQSVQFTSEPSFVFSIAPPVASPRFKPTPPTARLNANVEFCHSLVPPHQRDPPPAEPPLPPTPAAP